MKKWLLIALSCFFLCFSATSWAQATVTNGNGNDQAMAQTLIQNWFAAMKAGDTNKAASYLAPRFISIHTDGLVRNKTQEIELIKNLDMKSFNIANFRSFQSGDIIVVTYKEQGQEQIDKTQLSPQAAGRMAILQKQGNQWLIIAYANLHPIA